MGGNKHEGEDAIAAVPQATSTNQQIETVTAPLGGSKSLGQLAYEAYSAYTEGKSLVTKSTLPAWHGLTTEIQCAWQAAAKAVYTQSVKQTL